ncbi:MAG: GNAT family N-acetyltransferase [Candidatus Babeliales bacterium]|jgi:ribosomal protein S18 acetylase RimI-like enzyme
MVAYKKFFSVFSIIFIAFCLQTCTNNSQKLEIRFIDFNDEHEINSLYSFFSDKGIEESSEVSIAKIKNYIDESKYYLKKCKSEKYHIIIAKKGYKIYGAAIFFLFKNHDFWLKTIVVDKKYRRQGVATAMLQFLQKIPYIDTIYTHITSDNIAICALLQKLKFYSYSNISIMKKSSDDFDQYLNHQNSFTIYPLDKNNELDVNKMCQLFDDAEIYKKLNGYEPQELKNSLLTPEYQAFLAHDSKGQVCGALVYIVLSDDSVYKIEYLAVHKDYRRQGIAKTLIQAVQKLAFDNEIKTLQIAALVENTNALHCYQSIGFVEKHVSMKMKSI